MRSAHERAAEWASVITDGDVRWVTTWVTPQRPVRALDGLLADIVPYPTQRAAKRALGRRSWGGDEVMIYWGSPPVPIGRQLLGLGQPQHPTLYVWVRLAPSVDLDPVDALAPVVVHEWLHTFGRSPGDLHHAPIVDRGDEVATALATWSAWYAGLDR